MWQSPLHAAEEALIEGAIEKRRREFRAGRHAAHAALARLDAPAEPLLRGEHREPIWPAGFLGSITHTRDLCVAVCAREGEFAGLGIDAEPLEPLPRGVERYVHTESERRFVEEHPESYPERLIFSAKESLYKCYFPLLQRFFGFRAVDLQIDSAARRFDFTPTAGCDFAFPELRFHGRYAIGATHLVTACYLTRE